MLTRGVCRAMPGFLGIALADVTTPRAIRPCPPSFSLANTKIVSPRAIRLPPYIVFWARSSKLVADGSPISALTANARSPRHVADLASRDPSAPLVRRAAKLSASLRAGRWQAVNRLSTPRLE
jgi:hypothetical protein